MSSEPAGSPKTLLATWSALGLQERLRCARCQKPLSADKEERGFVCPNGHLMLFRGGYLLSGPTGTDETSRRTAESFGYEWTTFDDVRAEDQLLAERYLSDLVLARLAGGTGLDAGCGKGRFTRFLAPHLGALVALDASEAITVATRDLASIGNVVTVRSDLRSAPFADASFDFVSCLGVLHHLEAPEAGFNELARLLAPGGTMLLYLYSRPSDLGIRWAGIEAATLLRRVTVRMDRRALRWLSAAVAAVLRVGIVMPGEWAQERGSEWGAKLPLAVYRRRSFRALWLDTFDRLSAPVEHRYVWAELDQWFAKEGFIVESVREEAGFFIVARRPAA